MAQDGLRQWGRLRTTCLLCRSSYLARDGKRRYCAPACREDARVRLKRVPKRLCHLRMMEPERLSEALEAAMRVAGERPALASWVRLRVEAARAASPSIDPD